LYVEGLLLGLLCLHAVSGLSVVVRTMLVMRVSANQMNFVTVTAPDFIDE
jgi:hypothetical protein